METPKILLNVSGNCQIVPAYSNGIWNVAHGETILQHSLVRFHVQLLAMFLLSSSFHLVLRRFHLSRFTSEILTGIVLGPAIMGKYFNNASSKLFPPYEEIIISLSKFGYVLFAFLAGVRTDPTLIGKTGRTALILGSLSSVTAFIILESTGFLFPKGLKTGGAKNAKAMFARIYMACMIQTQFVGVSFILMQLKMINSQLGHIALASSLVNELLRLAFGLMSGFLYTFNVSERAGVQTIIFSLIFLVLILTLMKRLMLVVVRITPEGQPVKEIYATVTVATVFLISTWGDSIGLNYLVGPLILGLVLPARSPLAEILIAKFDTIVSGFLLPLMAMLYASKVDLWQIMKEFESLLIFKISLIGFTMKVAATFFLAKFCKIPTRHAVALALILNAKGINELGTLGSYSTFRDIHSTSGIFLIFLLQALQPLVKMLYHPAEHYLSYKKMSVEHASGDAEFKILTCAYRQEDAVAAIKLLEYSNPTQESPLSVHGLCLEELVSSFTPLLINHQLGQKNSSSKGSRSQPIVDIFRYLKSEHKKSVQVQVFTAISPLKQMHEDICWLSFNKSCSLIVLPFHKKWNSKGKMVSNNNDLRNLNIKVLELAPCSVGILIDRTRTHGLSSIFNTSATYRVATIFVGGPDDREALAYALRMARSPEVHLTVVRFIGHDDHAHQRWQFMIDEDLMRRLRSEMSGGTNINYIEKKVRDGSDTSSTIKSMVGDLDLIMVGRSSHGTDSEALSGLSEWTDLPELGPIGDLLASEDTTCPVSVLVVQQQIRKESPKIAWKFW
ncbi:hypothetical protein NC653_019280 [Populus alba x Populus x berolinensis]|nr:hypothetical protein NC653_019280 [Populus alba x Populus x berolinensis]